MDKLENLKLPFLPIFLAICIFCLSIGYAAINSITGEIVGKVYAHKQTGVFITDVSYFSDLYANKNNSKINNFVKTTLNTSVELSSTESNSAITYVVTIYNSSTDDYTFSEVAYASEFYDNSNIIFELTDLSVGDVLKSGEYVTFYVTFSYLDDIVSTNNVLNSYLNFKFTKVVSGYGDLEINYTLTKVWADGSYQFYRADFEITNVGTALINNWSITIPFTEVSFNAGWGSGVNVTHNADTSSILIESSSALQVNGTAEATIQFGVKDNNYEFGEFVVIIDGTTSEPNVPEVEEPTPEEPTPETPDPEEPEEGETEEKTYLPEIDAEGNYVYTLDDLKVILTPANSWSDGTGYFTQFNLSVTNITSLSIADWEFSIIATSGEEISQSWNIESDNVDGVITVSGTGNSLNASESYTQGGFIFKSPSENYVPTLK